MAQAYIIGDSSPFLKRVLIPFWVIRIAIMILEIILYAASIAIAASNRGTLNRIGDDNRTAGWVMGILAVIMVIIAACLILDVICIVKRSRRTLSPKFFLVANVIQTLVWLILFILTIIGGGSAFGFIIAAVILASFIGLLIYASVIYHRFRKGTLPRGNYAPANPTTGYTGGYTANEPNKTYDPNAPRYEMNQRYA
ncbi:hypothetical protein CORC01_06391 [Colletotrichum orchidophilum]|uniref:MARVEL domain-containing protein n=1 Tax=Colletotrichum orchidophilum TaxID=1209926 RepID=A0A1G4BAN3_9PEZI|nr:uncharacterized protein CORC01_06391 [Colletotrichum orchidophilum]OHE98395.1 hypothetical protein CORC01_06391 [Colletotrichum orchidophilum]